MPGLPLPVAPNESSDVFSSHGCIGDLVFTKSEKWNQITSIWMVARAQSSG